MTSSVATILGSDQAALLRYPEEPDIAEWAEQHITLSAGTELYRRFDASLAPWTRAVFRWFADNRVERMYLVQGSQVSKTVSMMICAVWAAQFRPGPAAWIGAAQDEVQAFIQERLKPMAEASGFKGTAKRDWKADAFRIGAMLVRPLWASSALKLRGFPFRYIFGDECAIWRTLPGVGHPLPYSWKRTRAFTGRRKGMYSTTPREEDELTWQTASAAPCYQWWVPCAKCGALQFLNFDNLQFGECKRADGTWDLGRVREETYYLCPYCQAATSEGEKLPMLAAGVLQRVNIETGEAIKDSGDGIHREVTLQIPASYSPFTPWGELAVSFLKATAEGPESLRIFVTDELARPWKTPGEAPTASELDRLIDGRATGTVPPEAVLLTAGVDVQADRCYYVIRAWGYRLRSWLVAAGICARAEASLSYLDEVLARDYGGFPISLTFIDSGYDADVVYEYARAHPGEVAPIKGRAEWSLPVQESLIEIVNGRRIKGGLKLYNINTGHWKGWVHHRIRIAPDAPGAWLLHGEVTEDYRRQLLNEVKVPHRHRGRKTEEWSVVRREWGSHYLDCEVYAAAAGWWLGVQRLEEGALGPAPASEPRERRGGWLDGGFHVARTGGGWLNRG